MPDFSDIAVEYDKIKDTPDVLGQTRTSDLNKATGVAADDTQIRKEILPDEETHYRLQQKLSTMFDKSSRAGAKSSLNGLVLPNGRKMFSEFHDKFTGTGRFQPQVKPDKVLLPENGRQLDVKQPSVVLYERCMDCLERVSKDEVVPNVIFLPPGNMMNEIARAKWAMVQIRPGSVLCYLFCSKCPEDAKNRVKAILHDPFKSQIMLPAPGGKMQSLAEIESHKYMAERGARISDNVFQQIKYNRDLPKSDVFYGDAII